jgi:hypothetical protein
MGYDLHIVRADGQPALDLAAWVSAVGSTPGARLSAAEAHTMTNPRTGAKLSVARREGDTEVLDAGTGQWRGAFTWRRDRATFRAPEGADHPAWRIAVALARRLDATIEGDEGERYALREDAIEAEE